MTRDEAFKLLKKGFLSNQMAHAYAIIGPPRGEGGLLADSLLQLVFCGSEDNRPCGECAACRQAQRHVHADLWWVEPQKKSRIISIEQVRQLQKFMFHTSLAGGWKACVLVHADRLGGDAANAFLKALEEPPPKSLYLLLTDSPQSFLATVMSRCQKVMISGERAQLPEPWREQVFEVLAGSSEGSAVRSLARAELMERICREMKKEAEKQEKELAGADEREEDDETVDGRINARYRGFRTCMMTQVLDWYRDVLLLSAGGDESLLMNQSRAAAIGKVAGATPLRQAIRHVKTAEDMYRQLEENLPERMVMGFGFSRLG